MTVPSPKLRQKTDNHSLTDKCALRRLLVKEAQLEPLRVLDLFAGEGHVWKELRRTPRPDPDIPPEDQPRPLVVEKYTPVDSAAKQPGQLRFKITPRLIAALDKDEGLRRYNVVDIDTYGDPWPLWHEVLFHIKACTAVFLTRGKVTYGAGRMPISIHAKAVMGIPREWNVPGKAELLDYGDRCQLLESCPTAHITLGYWIRFPRVDYYALLVEPTTGTVSSETSS
jgi:hypothetical protein